MKDQAKVVLATASIVVAGGIILFSGSPEDEVNYTPYISTQMAKVIMLSDDSDPQPEPKPDDDKILCDGSGWITHGDGHKTPCPGCDACESQTYAISNSQAEYFIYHLGAEWCGPCIKMKRETWPNESLRSKVKETNGKIFLFDADNPDHKKMFEYYKVSLYPTIVLVDKASGDIILKLEGFKSASDMINIINSNIGN